MAAWLVASGRDRPCPASSANLGPGFDALGLALELPFELAVGASPADGFLPCEPRHPATVAAFAAAGGDPGTDLWWRSPIPPGRGLGFSGAARVAGAFAASRDRDEAFATAVALEGHPDNAAASTFGGLVATASGRAVNVQLGADLEVVVWWPETETSTNAARAALPDVVDRSDAVLDIGHTALLVAALAAGDLDALSTAVTDRLHQRRRLEREPASRAAIDVLRRVGAIAAVAERFGADRRGIRHPRPGRRRAGCVPAGRSLTPAADRDRRRRRAPRPELTDLTSAQGLLRAEPVDDDHEQADDAGAGEGQPDPGAVVVVDPVEPEADAEESGEEEDQAEHRARPDPCGAERVARSSSHLRDVVGVDPDLADAEIEVDVDGRCAGTRVDAGGGVGVEAVLLRWLAGSQAWAESRCRTLGR